MSEPPGLPEAGGGSREISIGISGLAWTVAGAVFILLRLGPLWQAPVGGAELIHLSGAWQAREGIGDPRFVPTLFQGITALLLHWSASEVPPRVLAFLATATIPGALYLLRPQLGNAGALLALVILAFDGPAIALETEASAMGFDVAIALWLFVALARTARPPWLCGLAGFGLATAGPVPLPLVAAAAGLAAARHGPAWERRTVIAVAAGAAVGVAATTFRFGLGWDGLRVAPFDLFAAGFDERWSTATAAEVLAVYSWPMVAAGVAATLVRAARWKGETPLEALLLGWAAAALLWFAVAASTHSSVPVAALTAPLALILGPAAVRAWDAITRIDWRLPGVLLGTGGLLAAIAMYTVLKWARADEVGGTVEALLVAGLFLMAFAAAGYLGFDRRTAPALLAAAAVAGAIPVSAGTFGVALSGIEEPLPSPTVAPQASQLEALAADAARRAPGPIAVHPTLASDATWPFRETTTVITGAPGEAAVLIWPAGVPRPEGWVALDGTWALTASIAPPTGGILEYIKWLEDRNTVVVSQAPIAVYVRAQP